VGLWESVIAKRDHPGIHPRLSRENAKILLSVGLFIRGGFCDFKNDGSFDPENEEIIKGIMPTFSINGEEVDQYWNKETKRFQIYKLSSVKLSTE